MDKLPFLGSFEAVPGQISEFLGFRKAAHAARNEKPRRPIGRAGFFVGVKRRMGRGGGGSAMQASRALTSHHKILPNKSANLLHRL